MEVFQNENLMSTVVSKDVNKILDVLKKRNFTVDIQRDDYISASKTTLWGEHLITFEFKRIKGVGLFRMSTTSKYAEKEFKKLENLLE